MEVAPQVLEEKVHNYNEMMRNSEDTEWRRKTGLGEVIKAPFYAAETVPSTCDSAGRLTINQRAEVVGIWKQPIPGYTQPAVLPLDGGQGIRTTTSITVTFGRLTGEDLSKRKTDN